MTAGPRAVLAVPRAAGLLSGLLGTVLLVAGATPAHAVGYRYWSFWERDGQQWTYATQGPGVLRPEDGAVLGFRFSVSEDSQDAAKPRGENGFEAICGGTEPRPGHKRIALTVDFGTRADAPGKEVPPQGRAVCASVPEEGTAADALAATLKPLRYDSSSLLCAIAGYPRTGCGEQVSGSGDSGDSDRDDGGDETTGTAATGSAEGADDSGGPSAGLLGGLAVVAALGAAAVWQTRRRRS